MKTAEEVKYFLLNGGVCDLDHRIKSEFVCDVIRSIEAKGKYPYNSEVYDEIGRLLEIDLPEYYAKFGDNPNKNKNLSWLVYFNQEFRREDDLINDGYQIITQDMLENNVGKKLKTQSELYTIKLFSGKAYAMKKYARNKALNISIGDVWGKVV